MRSPKPLVSIRAMRKALKSTGLTRREAAKRTGVHESTLNNWLRNHRNPTPANLARLAEVLGVEVNDLVKRSATAADTQ